MDFALNNQQRLICHKAKKKKTNLFSSAEAVHVFYNPSRLDWGERKKERSNVFIG